MESPQVVSFTVGAQAGSTNKELFRAPSGFGGITILAAYVLSGAAATSELSLSNMGTALGTTIVSNIGTLNATLVANVPKAFTISTAYVDEGKWIALCTGAGDAALNAATIITIEYKFGK